MNANRSRAIKIPFHRPYLSGKEEPALKELLQSGQLGAPGPYHEACVEQIQTRQGAGHVLLMPSCTHALEAIGLLQEWGPGDEVIVPAYGFPSMANCVALRGATPVFAGIDPMTMNLDPAAAEQAITPRTRAILAMHYGGVACGMNALRALAEAHGLALIEDAAHGIGARFDQEGLGTLGDYGALSFHATKNIHCGEGGALLFRREADQEKFLEIAEKGTNKTRSPGNYQWQTRGSSYVMSALNAAFLNVQLRHAEEVNARRRVLWDRYADGLAACGLQERLQVYRPAPWQAFNAHLFFIKCPDAGVRERLLRYLEGQGIQAAPHYAPLSASPAGRRYGRVAGDDRAAIGESLRLLRLPLYPQLRENEVDRIVAMVAEFFKP
ncbi:MAG: dTDP-4-amino-4,6-dideoxygalactose transaminase [Haliscomenobacter sp.]|nr:dTDP-4-amino-4,6-dideoxygalactose transaminase [Haliscomenobacter sp.]